LIAAQKRAFKDKFFEFVYIVACQKKHLFAFFRKTYIRRKRPFSHQKVCPFGIDLIVNVNPLIFAPFADCPFFFFFEPETMGFMNEKIEFIIVCTFFMTQKRGPERIIAARGGSVRVKEASVISDKDTRLIFIVEKL